MTAVNFQESHREENTKEESINLKGENEGNRKEETKHEEEKYNIIYEKTKIEKKVVDTTDEEDTDEDAEEELVGKEKIKTHPVKINSKEWLNKSVSSINTQVESLHESQQPKQQQQHQQHEIQEEEEEEEEEGEEGEVKISKKNIKLEYMRQKSIKRREKTKQEKLIKITYRIIKKMMRLFNRIWMIKPYHNLEFRNEIMALAVTYYIGIIFVIGFTGNNVVKQVVTSYREARIEELMELWNIDQYTATILNYAEFTTMETLFVGIILVHPVYVCTKSKEIAINTLWFISVLIVLILHGIWGGGIGVPVVFLVSFIPLVSFVVQSKLVVFHIVMAISVYFLAILYDMIFAKVISTKEIKPYLAQLYFFITCLSTMNIFIIISFIINHKRITRLLENVANSITDLELNTKPIKKLMRKEISSCTKLEIKFRTIINNIRTYKTYLPAHLYRSNYMEVTEMSQTIDSQKQLSFETQSIRSSSSLKSSKNYQISTIKRKKRKKKHNAKKKSLQLKIAERNVTLLLVDIQRFHDALVTMVPEDLVALHTEFVENIEKIIASHRGIVHNMYGDKIMCSWNAVKPIINHEKQAAIAALSIQEWLNTSMNPLKALICCVSGDMYVGNMGSETLRRFVYLSPLVKNLYSMKTLIQQYPHLTDKIFVDQDTGELISAEFNTKPIAVTQNRTPKTMNQPYSIIYSLLDKRETPISPSEWFYEIADHLSGVDPLYLYKEAFHAYAKRHYVEALELFQNFLEKDSKPNVHVQVLIAELQQKLENNTSSFVQPF